MEENRETLLQETAEASVEETEICMASCEEGEGSLVETSEPAVSQNSYIPYKPQEDLMPNPYAQPGAQIPPNPYAQPGAQIPPNPYTQPGAQIPPNPYAQYGARNPYAQAYPQVPAGTYAPQGAYGQSAYPGYRPPVVPKKSKKGLTAFVLGLVGLALAYFTPALALPLGIIAIVFGIGGRKGAQGDQRERLFGLLGLIFGILATVGSVVVAVVTAVRFIELLRELMDLGYGSM